MLNICLLHFSARSGNLGVGALTQTQIQILRDIGAELDLDLKITILDWVSQNAPYLNGDDIRHVSMTGRDLIAPSGVYSLFRESDLIVDIGAGDSFTDIYGRKRIRRMLWLRNMALMAGRPLVLAPQTYGPFSATSTKLMARRIVTRSAVVAARDQRSVDCLAGLGMNEGVILASDVALKLPSSAKMPTGGRPRVGINVSGLLMSGGYDRANQFGLAMDYPKMIRQLITALNAHPEQPEIHLIPHVIAPEMPVEDDLKACRDLSREFPDIQVAPSFADPSAAKGYISGMDFFTGARMHSCIAAFSSGVAVMPVAYSRKFEGLFGSLGYDALVDARAVDADAAVVKLIEGFERRDMLREQAMTSCDRGIAALDRYVRALKEVMSEVSNKTGRARRPFGRNLIRS